MWKHPTALRGCGRRVATRCRVSFARPMPAAAFVGFVNQWRNTTMNANEPSTSCCVCCKEIPLDAAFTPEGAEYVEHFCGLECYQRFQARASTATETSVKPDACDSPPSG